MYAHLLCAGWGYRKSSLTPPCCAYRDMTDELGPGKALFLWGQRGWQMLFFKLRRPGQALKQPGVLNKDAAVVRVGNDTHLGAADGGWPCVSLRKHACLAPPMKCQLQHEKARKNADPVSTAWLPPWLWWMTIPLSAWAVRMIFLGGTRPER